MFTFRGHKGNARHNYAGERYTADATQCIIYALPELVPEGSPAPAPRAYVVPLIGSDGYDKIEVFNHYGFAVETLQGVKMDDVLPADLVAQMTKSSDRPTAIPAPPPIKGPSAPKTRKRN